MRTLKWIGLIVVCVPLLVVAGAYIRNKAIGPVGWAEENTLDQLRARMRDPDSMRVRSSFVVLRTTENGDTEISICGIVDGKNAFGGYAGETRFLSNSFHSERLGVFDTRTVEIEKAEETTAARSVGRLSGFEQVYWNKYCVDAQHPALGVES